MKSLPFGVFLILGVIIFALSGIDYGIFLNSHSIILVVFGTFAIFAIATPTLEIRTLFKAFINLRKHEFHEASIHKSLINLSQDKAASINSDHPLITYAKELWEQGLDTKMFELLLGQKLEDLNGTTAQAVASMRNIAKYPPALGMFGTVIGLVSLFSNLNEDSKSSLGPNLALALTATFYGLLLANFVLMPIADRLHVAHLSNMTRNEHILQVIMLIEHDEPTSIIEEELNAAA